MLEELVHDGQVRPLTDLERRQFEGLLRGESVVQEVPAAVPLLIPLMRPTTSEPLVACPRCYGQVSLPAQASPDMQVRCPLCGGEHVLSEAFYLPASSWAAAANPAPPPVGLDPLDLSTDPFQPRGQAPSQPAASPNRPTNIHLAPGNFAPLVEGLQLVRAGGMIELEIPATAYADSFPSPGVPPGATMHFVVELLEVF